MTREDQKKDELLALKQFLALAKPLGIEGVEQPLEPPKPDFSITLADGRVVGVEVTELVVNLVTQQGADIDRFRRAVTDELAKRGLTGMVVLSFSQPFDGVPKLLERRSAAQIAKWVEESQGTHNEITCERRTDTGTSWYETFGIVGLRHVALTPKAYRNVYAQPTVRGRDLPRVKEALEEKEALLEGYRAALPNSDLWLLLVAGTKFADPNFDYIDEYDDLSSGFDRVFWLDTGRRTPALRELSIAKSVGK